MPFLLKAQTKNISITWLDDTSQTTGYQGAKVSSEAIGKAVKVHQGYLSQDFSIFTDTWEDTGLANPTSLRLSNIQYGTISSEELKKIKTSQVPNSLQFSIQSHKGRDKIYTSVSVSPVINQNGLYKKVLSFSVNYNKSNANIGQRPLQLSNSVLATGSWYKFKIDQTGIYRLDKNFLNDLGMNTDGIDPRTIKVYGHGGLPLPYRNRYNTEFDIPQNAIQVLGEEDGSFDGSDAVLFYGIGVRGYDDTEDTFTSIATPINDTNVNPYSDDSYYYVTADGAPGLRVQAMVEPTSAPNITITDFHDYQFHELDENSPGLVGRRWMGNRFDIESEQSFEFNFPNIVTNVEPMHIVIKAGAVSEVMTSMAVSINGASVDPLSFGPVGNFQLVLTTDDYREDFPPPGDGNLKIDLAYNNSGNPSGIGYLDYIGIQGLRQLKGVEGQLKFQNNNVSTLSGTGEYQISNATQFSQVWDITNKGFINAKSNETGDVFSFKATMGELRKYVAVNPNNYFEPIQISPSQIPNQNLKGTIFNDEAGNFKDIDYLIVTAPFLIQPALRLANHHKNVYGLNVKVVTTDKIYEEFSSGKQDLSAIRNFVRYIYENASSADKRIKYLNLFGDTSVDYKNRLKNNNNIVPTYHTLYSGSTHDSYMSDDFFGMMGATELDDEGLMYGPEKLDIAVGRMVVDEVGLANAMVDKVIAYSSKESYGNWRNNFLLISDDLDQDNEWTLEVNLDALGDRISDEKPFVNVKKIHSDAYQQETSAGGQRYPQVNEAIINNIELGAVIVDYFGHGGEDGLAAEFIYTKEIAKNLKNTNRYPCIVTVTCEFSKFDNPLRITAGELTYQNREGGAISLLTTTRSISIGLGIVFNDSLADQLFGFGTNTPNTPAEGLRLSKNTLITPERRVVFFIGDPALHLAFPKREIRLTEVNGVPVSQFTGNLRALDRVSMKGVVVDEQGNLLTNYNGVLQAKIFDKDIQRQTLSNDGNFNNFIMQFKTLGESLFNGKATISSGTFEFEYVMPRDTQIPIGKGRVSLYSSRNGILEDQSGVNLDISMGGLNEDAPEDNQGPRIQLFMNDESFVSGGITNESPILLAKLADENGLNTSSGIGHDMIAILDGDESNPFVLNEYYQADVDDYSKGALNYKLRDLEDGLHTLTLKAWDVYNNSSTAEIQFIVAGGDAIEITKVLNYPNPFVDYTEFWFNHNRPYEPLDVQVQVFTVTGKVVWSKSETLAAEGSYLSRRITWNGRDDFGDRIGKGVYIYKITVKSTLTNKRVEKFEKLVIL